MTYPHAFTRAHPCGEHALLCVTCLPQAYFMRRSAAVLERLAEKLPYSAVALCRLLRPGALEAVPAPKPPAVAPRMLHATSSSSTVPVDVSGHSVGSSSHPSTPPPPPPLPLRSNRRDSHDAKLEQTGRSSAGAATSSPPPPTVAARRSSSSSSSSSAAEVTVDAGAEATRPCCRFYRPSFGGTADGGGCWGGGGGGMGSDGTR